MIFAKTLAGRILVFNMQNVKPKEVLIRNYEND